MEAFLEKISLTDTCEPVWEVAGSENYEKIYMFNEKEQKTIDDFNEVEFAEISIRGKKKDGKEVVFSAKDSLYQSLACCSYEPDRNRHIFPQKGEDGRLLLVVCRMGNRRVEKGGYFLEKVEVKGDVLHFQKVASKTYEAHAAEIVLWSKKRKEIIVKPIDVEEFNQGRIALDVSDIKEYLVEQFVRWSIHVRYRGKDGKLYFLRMEEKRNIHRLRKGNQMTFRFPKKMDYDKEMPDRFLDSISVETTHMDKPLVLSPNYTIDYQLSFQGGYAYKALMRAFSERLEEIEITEDALTVQIRCKKRGFHIKGFGAELRSSNPVRFSFEELERVDEGDSIRLVYQAKLQEIPWKPMFYSFFVEEEKDGIVYDIRPKNTKRSFQRRMYNPKWRNSATIGDNIMILYGMKNGEVILRFREKTQYDDVSYRYLEKKARFLYLLFKPIWDHLGIVVMFERFSTAAQDNGVHMFRYYMEQGRKRVYYVIRSDMPDYDKVKEYKENVLEFMSLRHMIYMQAAKVYISTDTKKHGYQWVGPNSDVYNKILKKPAVFLQHGVLAMKEVSSIYDRYRHNAADLFITSSEMEKGFVNESFRYEPERIAVTGLARWDVLFDKQQECKEKEILFIPTWRGWMDNITEEEFLQSDYYFAYKHILESKRLDELLKKYNMKMIFCMHHKFREFAKEFPQVSERIQIFDFGDTPVNELLMRCSFLVTDYSSVAWDTYYQGKPNIFYQFDYEKYMELQGSYFDMEKDLFGVRVTEEEALYDAMEECMASGFEEKEEFKKLRDYYLPYRDHRHRERIDEEIKKMKFNGTSYLDKEKFHISKVLKVFSFIRTTCIRMKQKVFS